MTGTPLVAPPTGGGLVVSGGAGGIAARTEDLDQASEALRAAAAGLAGVATGVAGVAARPGLLGTGLAAPVSLARAEGALAAVLAGPQGLVAAGLRLEALAVRLSGAALAYRGADAVARTAVHRLGMAAGGLAAGLGPAVVAGPWPADGGVLLEPVVALLPQAFAPAGPLWHPLTGVPGAAAVLAAVGRAGVLLDESGRVVATPRRRGPAVPPAGLADVMSRVVACYPEAGAGPGTVRVERVDGPDGSRSWVVEIPGTQEWSPLAGSNPADLTADVAVLGGTPTAAGETVRRALEIAGAAPTEPVLLAGHSLGGMVAAALAADPTFTRRFRVTHVVAAGSPVAGFRVRPGVQVLAIEHDDDLVPALDGAPNPDLADWVTVRRRPARGRHPGAAHDVGGYVDTAALVDGSADPSVRAWRAGLRPFLARPGATATDLVVVGRRVP